MATIERAVDYRDPRRTSSTAARMHKIKGQIALAKRNLPASLAGCRIFSQSGRLFVRHGNVTFSGASVAKLVERAAQVTPDTSSPAAQARAKVERIKAAALAARSKSRY